MCLLTNVAVPSDRNAMHTGMKRNSANVEYEMPRHTSNHWGHWNCN